MGQTYWAAKETKEMLTDAFKRIDDYYEHLKTDGVLDHWRRQLSGYYAGADTKGKIQTGGDQEELTLIKVNHFHNLGEHIVSAIAGQAPAFVPQAANNDQDSVAQVGVSNAILDDCASQKNLSEVFIETTRAAFVITEGWGSVEWDERLGDPVAAIEGRVVKNGDVRIRKFTPDNVVRDWIRDSAEDHEWVISRRWENRWNVIARARQAAPDEETANQWADLIEGIPSKAQEWEDRPRLQTLTKDQDSDEIAVWELRHEKTDALPAGRRCVFVSPVVWLSDGPLPFRDLQFYRLAPEEQIGSESGYSQGLDLLAPQAAVNAAYSAVLSSLSALGNPLIWVAPNSNVSTEELKGFTIIKSAQEPKGITLLDPNAVKPHADFAQNLVQQMEVTSGVNAVRRGNLEAAGKLSGAAYALIDAKFMESVVGLQRAFRQFARRIATAILWTYQDFATVERTVNVAGKSKRVAAKSFTGEGLKKVLRVDVEIGDPLTRTSSGKLQLAEMLLKAPDANGGMMIKTPEQFIQVLTTGRLEPLVEGQDRELQNIRAENEMLAEGKVPQAFIYDDHPLHLQEHYSVVASPESRADEKVASATLAHMAEHLAQWQAAPVDGLLARNIQPAPSLAAMAPGAPPGPGGQPPGPGAGLPADVPVGGPDGSAPGQPFMPSMPMNPQTGERAPGPPTA